MDIKKVPFDYTRHFLTNGANRKFVGALSEGRVRACQFSPVFYLDWKLTRSAGTAIAMASRQTSA
jgi:hypothetical protein